MATKFLTYLQAGLPVVIDADNHYMAGLVERYNIGVVLQDHDLEHLPEILNSVDLPALKRNVVKFRERIQHRKGRRQGPEDVPRDSREGGKPFACVARLGRARLAELPHVQTSHFKLPNDPVFEQMIDVMARRENRLYYRDQSARTMSSLAALARQLDPSVIVELGTLGGLSLRTWIASTTADQDLRGGSELPDASRDAGVPACRSLSRDAPGAGHSQDRFRPSLDRAGQGDLLRGRARSAERADHDARARNGVAFPARRAAWSSSTICGSARRD